jgi:hypothetical protein
MDDTIFYLIVSAIMYKKIILRFLEENLDDL